MNFSAWSIRNPIAPILLFVLLMVLGWQSFNTLPITRFPNIDVPLVAVSVTQAGAAPAELETQVTKKIEDAVAGITGVKNIISTLSDGNSTTAVEFRMEVPTDKAVQDVKDAIDQIIGDLPGSADTPIVTRIDVEGQAIMTFAVSAPQMQLEDLSWFVDDTVTRALQGKPGIGRVDRYGGADREIRVELDPVRLESFGLTATAVSQQLNLTNANVGGGKSEIAGGQQAIRTLGDAATAAKLAETSIWLPSGRYVRVSDLGRVIDTYEEPKSFARFNGETVVVFAVFRAKGASEVSVAEVVNETLEELRAAHPEVRISPVDDTVYYTYGNYEAALHTLIEGAILAVLVVLAFLRNWRATLIAAVALPLSAVPTFWVMDILGFSLNLVSFLAITLATGILVDDAIVEIENIARHIRMGKTPYRAAIEAADEIGLAVIATSATIVAVFVPVSFMPGIPGQYFRQFGLTVAIAVIFSLLVARLITPLMAAYLMSAKDAEEHHAGDGATMRGYLWVVRRTTGGGLPLPNPLFLLFPLRSVPVLGALVRHWWFRFPARYLTLTAAVLVLAVSVFYMARIPGSFIPPEDVSRIPVSVELPPGTTLEQTDRTTQAMVAAVEGVEGVDSVFVLGGTSPTGDRDIRRASVTVILEKLDHSLLRRVAEIGQTIPLIGPFVPEVPSSGRLRPQNLIEAEIFQKFAAIPDLRAFKLNDRGERDLSYSILAATEADLDEGVARIEAALRGDPLLANVAAEGALPRPEVQVVPRADEAARLGVTARAIAETLRIATIGDFDAALAKVSVDDRLIPVRVQLADGATDTLERIGALKVATSGGQMVPLASVADVFIAEGPSTITRLNRDRRATIGANLPPGVALDTASGRINDIVFGNPDKEIKPLALPASVRVQPSGDAEVQKELTQSFGNAMLMGLMLVLTVLILLFHSVIQPFTILFSLPLAIGGVAAALIVTGNAVSMPVLIGLLMLMGIVTKNAILLVDFAIEMMDRGMSRFDAMVEAGHKRARPIVMTSIAMSAGMLPSALGVGEGGAFRAPMAIAVIGGIIVSTVLSLVIVPAFFLIMDDVQKLLVWMFGWMVGSKDEESEPPSPEVLAAGLSAANHAIGGLSARIAELEGRVEQGQGSARRYVAE